MSSWRFSSTAARREPSNRSSGHRDLYVFACIENDDLYLLSAFAEVLCHGLFEQAVRLLPHPPPPPLSWGRDHYLCD